MYDKGGYIMASYDVSVRSYDCIISCINYHRNHHEVMLDGIEFHRYFEMGLIGRSFGRIFLPMMFLYNFRTVSEGWMAHPHCWLKV